MESEDSDINVCGTLCLLCGTLCNSFLIRSKVVILILYFFNTPLINGQNKELTQSLIDIAEELADADSDPEAVSLFVERLNDLSEDPVKINSNDESEISRLFFLSGFQIKTILDHTTKTGNIVSVYEIASIPGFDRHIVEMMIPFITIAGNDKLKTPVSGLHNSMITSLAFKPGERDTSMAGNQLKVVSKFKTSMGPFTAGITAEKDPGETLITGTPPLPDFLSAFISYSGKGVLRRFIAGDYSARFGEGTGINTGMRMGLSLTSPLNIPGHDDIRPYTSTDENSFLRGVAILISLKMLNLSFMFSHNAIDASTAWSADSVVRYVTGFRKSGLHGTESLLQTKDAVTETFSGLNVSFNSKSAKAGFTWCESLFSLPVMTSENDPRQLFGFEGRRNSIYSLYYNTVVKRVIMSGEISADRSFDPVFIQRVSLSLSDRFTAGFLYRNYSPRFSPAHGRGPGTGPVTSNETGLLGNFTFEAAKYLFISGGADITWYPWLKYRTGFPSYAIKEELKITYLPQESFSAEAVYSYRQTMSDSEACEGIPGIKIMTSDTFRGMFRYSPSRDLILSTRIEYKTIRESQSRGMLLYNDLKYCPGNLPVTLWLRHCIFATDNWDSRLYVYENDMLHSFSIPAFSGTGSRSYIMAEWEIGDFAGLRLKYSITSLTEATKSYNERDEIRLQFRLRF